MKFLLIFFLIFFQFVLISQVEIPKTLHNLEVKNAKIVFTDPKTKIEYIQADKKSKYTIDNFRNCVVGTETGIKFDFKNKELNGKLYWGFYPLKNANAQYPIFYKKPATILNGIAEIEIKDEISMKHDIADFINKKKFKIGYRIQDDQGVIIYDGKANFKGTGPFELSNSIISGPFINMLTDSSAVISFETNFASKCFVSIGNTIFSDSIDVINHEIQITKLKPNTKYEYAVVFGDNIEKSNFTTAPVNGSRKPFKFAFASDCRQGQGGGERAIWGVNSYILKKISALTINKKSAFWQFTGDVIQGYLTNPAELKLQYSNFKRTIEPFAHSVPLYVGIGNHEVVTNQFDSDNKSIRINKFPYKEQSMEKYFADEFVNFSNGPDSEDGSNCDPDLSNIDFPSYKENAYFYTYDNMAMIVLNSNYLYTADKTKTDVIGGNLHGYIMDNQLKWLESVLNKFEKDKNIDHIFVTIHTPAFPNGGHIDDDMWYGGNNYYRPYINGKPAEKGIIERRDEFLDLIINKSKKTVALLCGDEHNYSRLLLNSNSNIYPENWDKPKLKISRNFWQITNGSAGAPYYSQEIVPWTNDVKYFSNQYALCFFNINNKKVTLEVIDPDTLEEIETVNLK